jgi:hypothetical protein
MANGLPEHPPAPPTLEQRGKVILATTLFILHLPFLILEVFGHQWHDMAVTSSFCFIVFSAAARSKGLSLALIRALLIMPAIVLLTLLWFGLADQGLREWKPTPAFVGTGVLALVAYGALIRVYYFSPPVNAYLRQIESDDVRAIFRRAAERRAQRAQAERVSD